MRLRIYRRSICAVAVAVASVFGGCLQVQNRARPPLPPHRLKEETLKVADSITRTPNWIFPADGCPAEVMPASGAKPLYMADGCADDPDRCFVKCQANDPTACYALATLVEQEAEVGNEASQALYLQACKLGIVSGCTNRAAAMVGLAQDEPDAQRCATDTFEKACSQNDAWGCTMFGAALANGDGRVKDVPAAMDALSKACKISADAAAPACKNAQELRDTLLRSKNS